MVPEQMIFARRTVSSVRQTAHLAAKKFDLPELFSFDTIPLLRKRPNPRLPKW
jgi:hypothetical protein